MEIQEYEELRKAIENFLYAFDELSSRYGFTRIFKLLQTQYLDISSFEDAVINTLIDGLEDPDSTFYVQFMEEERIKETPLLVKSLIDNRLLPAITIIKNNIVSMQSKVSRAAEVLLRRE